MDITKEWHLCPCCGLKVVENEYHFILVCPSYRSIRTGLSKLEHLLQAANTSLPVKSCKYLKATWNAKYRNNSTSINPQHIDARASKRNSKIPKGQIEIVKSEDRQDHGQQNETKDKYRTHNTTLKTKAGITRTLQKPGWVQVLRKGKQLLLH